MSEKPSIDSIFCGAVDIQSTAEREAYLKRVCGSDPEIRQQVDRLLDAHYKGGSILDSPPHGLGATINQAITEKAGDTIGPYKLLQQIGEGGMGVVYMADQTAPVERRVALKIIKPGMDSRQVVARFEAERQALALMDHPSIARVLDAGTTDTGRPYFVMELVKGMPITTYCDERQLTPRQRLELFIPVCQAIQHAHQKGIIHRDIKPSNVLVAHYDDQPVPKIIDFGVAKAIEHRLTEKTMFTEYGQVLGTLEYMSPEQARFNQWDIDTRSDVYSLGVLLYELLSGETPFDRDRLRSAAFDELLRIIREEEPPKPSTRASNSTSLPAIAANRQTEPSKLTTAIHGELDWIVMKALEKDRTRRYETANGLAMDVKRHLADEAVLAGPPSASYRLQKFMRRNRRLVMAAALMAVVVLLGFATSTALYALAEARAEQLRRALYAAYIAQSAAALEENNPSRAAQLLEDCPEDLRHWEWDHLSLLSARTTVTRGFSGQLMDVALTPDGKRLVAKDHQALKLLDVASGRELWAVDDELICMALGPQGKQLAVGDHGGLRIWNLDRLDEEPVSIPGHSPWMFGIAFSPTGEWIVASSVNSFKIAHAATGKLLPTQINVKDQVGPVSISPDGKRVVTRRAGRQFSLWAVETGDLVWTSQLSDDVISNLAFHPNGETLAAGCVDGTLVLFSAASGQPLRVLPGHTSVVNAVSFSPDGTRLFSASSDGTVKVWNTRTNEELLTLRGHSENVVSLALSPDGQTLASCSADGTVRVWHSQAGKIDTDSPQSLVAHWTFDEGRGGRVGDSAGDADSFAVGPLWGPGPVGGALELDGETSFVDVPMTRRRFAQFTIAMWLKIDQLNQRYTSLISNKGWFPHVIHYLLYDEYGGGVDCVLELSIHGNVEPTENSDAHVSERLLTAGRWYHVVTTYDSETGDVHYYIDGHLDVHKQFTTAHEADLGYPDGAYIGTALETWGPDRYLDGALDDIRIYDYVLDSEEVARLFAAGDPPPPDRSHYRAQAISNLARGEFDAAVELYERFLLADDETAVGKRNGAEVERELFQALETRLNDNALSPQDYNDRAWSLVERPVDPRLARIAVRLAQKALEQVPDEANILNTLGIAQYRAGEFQHALTTLTRADSLNVDDPWNLIFLAMTRQQFGDTHEAREMFARASEIIDQRWVDTRVWHQVADAWQRLQAEATALIGAPQGE